MIIPIFALLNDDYENSHFNTMNTFLNAIKILMLYDKTNENNSLLEDVKSFCLALILVTTLFYVGLSSLPFNHSTKAFSTAQKLVPDTEPVPKFVSNPVIEICKDPLFAMDLDTATKANLTITQHNIFVKSTRLSNKMKIKDPAQFNTPPAGLSSSFKKFLVPLKQIKSPVTTLKETPIISASKTSKLDRSFSCNNKSSTNNNGSIVTTVAFDKDLNKIILESIPTKKQNFVDHIPTDQTKRLMASNELN